MGPADPSNGKVVVEVLASVTQPEKVQSYISNTFSFVFHVNLGASGAKTLKRVLPENEEEEARVRGYLASD